jgi:hypothetical protein
MIKKILLGFCLFFSVYSFSQKVDSHIVKIPSTRLKVIFLSKNKPVISGSVIVIKGRPINDGLFYIFDTEGNVIQTITYKMGRVIKISNNNESDTKNKRRI